MAVKFRIILENNQNRFQSPRYRNQTLLQCINRPIRTPAHFLQNNVPFTSGTTNHQHSQLQKSRKMPSNSSQEIANKSRSSGREILTYDQERLYGPRYAAGVP